MVIGNWEIVYEIRLLYLVECAIAYDVILRIAYLEFVNSSWKLGNVHLKVKDFFFQVLNKKVTPNFK